MSMKNLFLFTYWKKSDSCVYTDFFYIHLVQLIHGLWTPGEEMAFTEWPKIQSQSRIFRYGRSVFCLPHRPKFSDFFDLCLHWVSVVHELIQTTNTNLESLQRFFCLSTFWVRYKVNFPIEIKIHHKMLI